MLRNCEECNRVFSHPSRGLCPECYEKAQKDFDAVRNYLKENPGATVVEVARETEVDVDLIYEYSQEGRLDVVPRDASLQCTICGASITIGRVCARCRNDLRNTMSQKAQAPKLKSRQDAKVYTIEHLKSRND
jgi:flagellar operon protein (TIGR03826 family)